MRNWLLTHLIRLYWWCDWFLENCPHPKQHKPIFFEPISATALITSLIVSGVSFGANLIINSLLAPKPKPVVKGKLTGEISLTDSIFGFPIYRIYGGRPATDNSGGVEVGGNIIWLPKIDKIQTTTQQPTGGGKGRGGRTQTTTTITYKVDIAVAFGTGNGGRLRLLRLKLNEDTVYNITGGGGTNPFPEPVRYEAEAAGNTRSGGAVVAADAQCSNGQKVTGIGSGGVLVFNDVSVELPPPEPDQVPATARMDILVRYKSVGDRQAYVKFNGTGGIYTFPDSAGAVAYKYISRNYILGFDLEISNPTAAGPEIDCIDVEGYRIYEEENPFPNGVRDELFPPEAAQDNMLLPDPKDFDTNAFERFNGQAAANDGLLEITLPNGAEMTWYEGAPDQPVDPIIAAQVNGEYGANSCPAFLDIAYCRIKRLDISKYGSVPNFRALVENIELQTVEEILLAEASLVELLPEDFELSAVGARHSRGYLAGGLQPPDKAFEDFALLENISFVESSDGTIVAKDLTDRTVVAQITAADLGAYILDEQQTPPADDAVSTIEDEIELVREYELSYYDPKANSDYNTDRVTVAFPYTGSRRRETKSVTATLTESEAVAISKRELQKHHQKDSAPMGYTTSYKYSWTDAGDCIEVEIGGEFKRVRIEEKTGSAPGVYEIAATDEAIEVYADQTVEVTVGDKSPISNAVRFPANSVGTIIDIPALSEQQENRAGVYVAACRKGVWGDWAGCGVFRETGGVFGMLAQIERECVIGVTADALGDIPSEYTNDIFDSSASVTVDWFGDFEPTTLTSLQAEDGLGAYVIGEEVCVVKTWTRDNDFPNRWIGTEIYRILKHTDTKAAAHQSGERVVFLDDAVKFVPLDRDEVGIERVWKFVTAGQHLEDAAPVTFVWNGDNIYNKVHYTNTGASGAVTHFLPLAAAGLEYGFEVVAGYEYLIEASAGEIIRVGQAEGGKIASSSAGSFIYLKAFDGKWTATGITGEWEVI